MKDSSECGKKNPSTMNNIGSDTNSKRRKKTASENFSKIKPTAEVFQQLEDLPRLTEFERANLSKF